MNLQQLVHDTLLVLAPALPLLTEAGKGAAKKVGEKTGEAVSDTARKIWDWLRPKAQASQPALLDAAHALATQGESRATRGSLELHLLELLEKEPALQGELQRLLGPVAIQQNTATASGAGAVAVGGNVTGGSISTNVKR